MEQTTPPTEPVHVPLSQEVQDLGAKVYAYMTEAEDDWLKVAVRGQLSQANRKHFRIIYDLRDTPELMLLLAEEAIRIDRTHRGVAGADVYTVERTTTIYKMGKPVVSKTFTFTLPAPEKKGRLERFENFLRQKLGG
jgi:hypothetical protein